MSQRLFLPNFEFEHRLGPNPIQALNQQLLRINSEYAASLFLIGQDGDRIWLPETVSDSFFDAMAGLGLPRVRGFPTNRQQELHGLEITPWGWSPNLAKQFPIVEPSLHPDIRTVERVNSRRFSFALEQEFDCGLAGSAQVESLSELVDVIQSVGQSGAWVVKAEFSMSARERFLGRGQTVSAELRNWATKRLRGGQALFIEPWVKIAAEHGVQFEISPQGDVQLLGITRLLSDDAGRYSGSVAYFNSPDNLGNDEGAIEAGLARVIETCRAAAKRVAEAGYFGPLGIDAAQVHDPIEGLSLRPIQDINARFTMGRMCLGFQPLLRLGEQVKWIHTSRDKLSGGDLRGGEAAHQLLNDSYPQARLIIPTTPELVADQPTQLATWAIIEPAHVPPSST